MRRSRFCQGCGHRQGGRAYGLCLVVVKGEVCPCLKPPIVILPGQRFGSLTVTEVLSAQDAGEATRAGALARLRCDCGQRVTLRCGLLRRHPLAARDCGTSTHPRREREHGAGEKQQGCGR